MDPRRLEDGDDTTVPQEQVIKVETLLKVETLSTGVKLDVVKCTTSNKLHNDTVLFFSSMEGSTQSSGDADKSQTHAPQGLPPGEEKDLNSAKNENTKKNNKPCQKDMGAPSQLFQSI